MFTGMAAFISPISIASVCLMLWLCIEGASGTGCDNTVGSEFGTFPISDSITCPSGSGIRKYWLYKSGCVLQKLCVQCSDALGHSACFGDPTIAANNGNDCSTYQPHTILLFNKIAVFPDWNGGAWGDPIVYLEVYCHEPGNPDPGFAGDYGYDVIACGGSYSDLQFAPDSALLPDGYIMTGLRAGSSLNQNAVTGLQLTYAPNDCVPAPPSPPPAPQPAPGFFPVAPAPVPAPAPTPATAAPTTCACIYQGCSSQSCCAGLVCQTGNGYSQCQDTSPNPTYTYDGHRCAPLFGYAGSGTEYFPYTTCCNGDAYVNTANTCSLPCQGVAEQVTASPTPAPSSSSCICVFGDCSSNSCCAGLTCQNVNGYSHQCVDSYPASSPYVYDGVTCAPLFGYAGSGNSFYPFTTCCNPSASIYSNVCALPCQAGTGTASTTSADM